MCERLTDEEKQAARSLVAKDRPGAGPAPTERELWAYHLGEMSAPEEDRFAERLAHYPAAVKWLARLSEGEPDNGHPSAAAREVTAEETEAAWERWLRESGGGAGGMLSPPPTNREVPVAHDPNQPDAEAWPPLSLRAWSDTCATLHLFTQVVGKVRMVQTPWVNHSWSVSLAVSPRGLTTGWVPHGDEALEVEFDFLGHSLEVVTSRGGRRSFALEGLSVAGFYRELMEALDELGMPVDVVEIPNELEEVIPFPEDEEHATYDPDAVHRYWRALLATQRVFTRFRSRFLGKVSPVHFFWGAFDLAVSRFSGEPAPEHPGGLPNFPDPVAKEAYSHEVSSAGFWPGNVGGPVEEASYYSYVYPAPEGFSQAEVSPEAAYWSDELGEWVLPYEAVRTADDPEETLMSFLQSTYEAAANLAGWDREALEREEGRP